MAVIGSDIYYVLNGEMNPFVKPNVVKSKIDTIGLTEIIVLGTLDFRANYFFTTDKDSMVKIDGWITSIRPN